MSQEVTTWADRWNLLQKLPYEDLTHRKHDTPTEFPEYHGMMEWILQKPFFEDDTPLTVEFDYHRPQYMGTILHFLHLTENRAIAYPAQLFFHAEMNYRTHIFKFEILYRKSGVNKHSSIVLYKHHVAEEKNPNNNITTLPPVPPTIRQWVSDYLEKVPIMVINELLDMMISPVYYNIAFNTANDNGLYVVLNTQRNVSISALSWVTLGNKLATYQTPLALFAEVFLLNFVFQNQLDFKVRRNHDLQIILDEPFDRAHEPFDRVKPANVYEYLYWVGIELFHIAPERLRPLLLPYYNLLSPDQIKHIRSEYAFEVNGIIGIVSGQESALVVDDTPVKKSTRKKVTPGAKAN